MWDVGKAFGVLDFRVRDENLVFWQGILHFYTVNSDWQPDARFWTSLQSLSPSGSVRFQWRAGENTASVMVATRRFKFWGWGLRLSTVEAQKLETQ